MPLRMPSRTCTALSWVGAAAVVGPIRVGPVCVGATCTSGRGRARSGRSEPLREACGWTVSTARLSSVTLFEGSLGWKLLDLSPRDPIAAHTIRASNTPLSSNNPSTHARAVRPSLVFVPGTTSPRRWMGLSSTENRSQAVARMPRDELLASDGHGCTCDVRTSHVRESILALLVLGCVGGRRGLATSPGIPAAAAHERRNTLTLRHRPRVAPQSGLTEGRAHVIANSVQRRRRSAAAAAAGSNAENHSGREQEGHHGALHVTLQVKGLGTRCSGSASSYEPHQDRPGPSLTQD